MGYNGCRVGEALNPGPFDSQQMSVLMQLLQTLISLVAQMAGGSAGDATEKLNEASAALTRLSRGTSEPAPRQVRPAENKEDEWEEVRSRRRRKPGGSRDDKPGPSAPPARTVVVERPTVPKGKGKGEQINQAGGKGKGRGPGATRAAVRGPHPHRRDRRALPAMWESCVLVIGRASS